MTEVAAEQNAPEADPEANRGKLVQWLSKNVTKIGKIDPDPALTARLYRYVSSKVNAELMGRKREAAAAEAKKNYTPTGLSCKFYRSRIKSVKEQLDFQNRLYDALYDNVESYLSIELMKYTVHGKAAVGNAKLNIGIIRQSSKDLSKQYEALFGRISVDPTFTRDNSYPPDAPERDAISAPEDLDRERVAFEALAEATLHEADGVIRTARADLTEALEYESFKAIIKLSPDEFDEMIEQAENVAGHVIGGVKAVSGFVPVGSAEKALEGAASLGDVLKHFAARAAKSYNTNKRIKEVMKDPAKRTQAIRDLNDYPLAAAVYLKNKYVLTIEGHFALLDMAKTVTLIAIDVGVEAGTKGAGVVATKAMNKAIDTIWDHLKDWIITFLNAIQEQRIQTALKILREARDTEAGVAAAAAGAAAPVAGVFADYVKTAPKLMFEDIKAKHGENIFNLLNPVGVAVDAFVGSLIKHFLKQLDIEPAQFFTADTLADALASSSQQTLMDQALPK